MHAPIIATGGYPTMKKQLLTIIIAAGLLASCGTNPVESSKEASAPVTSESVTWVSPTGSPTLAFYDQGENDKWLSTATPENVIPSAFASASYDAIVFDGVSGLTMIKNMNRAYKLAKWINEGSFYVVSTKHTAEEAVTAGSKPSVNAFVSTGNASKAFAPATFRPFSYANQLLMELAYFPESICSSDVTCLFRSFPAVVTMMQVDASIAAATSRIAAMVSFPLIVFNI